MNYLYLIVFLFMFLPGIYLASKKNFLIIHNNKYNTFLVRLLFTVPAGLILSFSISVFLLIFVFLSLKIALKDLLPIEYVLTFPLILSSLLLIFLFKKYLIRSDLPPEFNPDFLNHELYVYLPHQKFLRRSNFIFFGPLGLFFMPRNDQKKNLDVDFKQLENKDIVFTDLGEFIVSERVLSIFSNNGFNDLFETKPVTVSKGLIRRSSVKTSYYQLIPKNMMPPLHPQTKIKKTSSFDLSVIFGIDNNELPRSPKFVVDDKFYYDNIVLETMADFNATSEALGAYGIGHQKLWIVSKKAMEVLLTKFNQQKRDFIPVMLVDDEKVREK